MNIAEPARTIIEAALQAPSGENSQPWLFKVDDNKIELYHDLHSDTSLYNFENRGSLLAHGAAIENMCIAAAALGYMSKVSVFPTPAHSEHVATIIFTVSKKNLDAESLNQVISQRTSNRKPYKVDPLMPEHVDALLSAAQSFVAEGLQYQRITQKGQIQALAVVAATNEEVMLQNRELHQFFFSHLSWTKAEDAQKKVGFYIKTLELPPPARALFKLMRHWRVMSLFIKIGFPAVVRATNAKTDAAAGEYGIITTERDTPESLVQTGRMMQRIWLTATKSGLQMQLMTGTLYLHHAAQKTPQAFSSHEHALLNVQMEKLYSMLEKKRAVVVCMFRVGYGEKATARATRYTPEERLV